MYATVELESGAMYRYERAGHRHMCRHWQTLPPPFCPFDLVPMGRTTFAQGQFRLGVVYKPVEAFHPRVFSRIKSLLRTPKQV